MTYPRGIYKAPSSPSLSPRGLGSPPLSPSAAAAARHPVGSRVELHSLRPEWGMNGKRARVAEHRRSSTDGTLRLVVAVDGARKRRVVKPHNVRALAAAPTSPLSSSSARRRRRSRSRSRSQHEGEGLRQQPPLGTLLEVCGDGGGSPVPAALRARVGQVVGHRRGAGGAPSVALRFGGGERVVVPTRHTRRPGGSPTTSYYASSAPPSTTGEGSRVSSPRPRPAAAAAASSSVVEVHSLVNDTALNGQVGDVVGRRTASDGTPCVELALPGGVRRTVPTANVRRPSVPPPRLSSPRPSGASSPPPARHTTATTAGSLVVIHSLTRNPELNGRVGSVVAHKTATDGRPCVELAFGGGAAARVVPASRVRPFLPVGTRATVHSLEKMRELNGRAGRVAQHRQAKDGEPCVLLAFDDGTTQLVRAANVRPASAAPPPTAAAAAIHAALRAGDEPAVFASLRALRDAEEWEALRAEYLRGGRNRGLEGAMRGNLTRPALDECRAILAARGVVAPLSSAADGAAGSSVVGAPMSPGAVADKRCRRGHAMVMCELRASSAGTYDAGWRCDSCARVSSARRWHCAECREDRCAICLPAVKSPVSAGGPSSAVAERRCNEGHVMVVTSLQKQRRRRGAAYYADGWRCDECGRTSHDDRRWHCRACEEDRCLACLTNIKSPAPNPIAAAFGVSAKVPVQPAQTYTKAANRPGEADDDDDGSSVGGGGGPARFLDLHPQNLALTPSYPEDLLRQQAALQGGNSEGGVVATSPLHVATAAQYPFHFKDRPDQQRALQQQKQQQRQQQQPLQAVTTTVASSGADGDVFASGTAAVTRPLLPLSSAHSYPQPLPPPPSGAAAAASHPVQYVYQVKPGKRRRREKNRSASPSLSSTSSSSGTTSGTTSSSGSDSDSSDDSTASSGGSGSSATTEEIVVEGGPPGSSPPTVHVHHYHGAVARPQRRDTDGNPIDGVFAARLRAGGAAYPLTSAERSLHELVGQRAAVAATPAAPRARSPPRTTPAPLPAAVGGAVGCAADQARYHADAAATHARLAVEAAADGAAVEAGAAAAAAAYSVPRPRTLIDPATGSEILLTSSPVRPLGRSPPVDPFLTLAPPLPLPPPPPAAAARGYPRHASRQSSLSLSHGAREAFPRTWTAAAAAAAAGASPGRASSAYSRSPVPSLRLSPKPGGGSNGAARLRVSPPLP